MTRGRGTTLGVLTLLLAQLVLLTSQVRDEDSGGTRLEALALRLMAPATRLVRGTVNLVAAAGSELRSNDALRAELSRLEEEVQALHLERLRLRTVDDQVERLSNALGYRPPFQGEHRLADVVYVDHASWLQTLFVFMPGRQAATSSPVTSTDGLVGRVILAEGSYAKVQLVTDRASGIGAMIERTRRQGIARGAGRDGLTLEYVPLQADVQVGDRVLTSGTDGLYPRGIPIGTVLEVAPGGELFHAIRLAPAVDFGMLDQVFVLLADSLPGRLKASTSASP
ncbi:MAG TPA: rod shape-determining protein MreC [Thermoanaerobaculia bacterium]|nr:rod shape-determining protein MreC [Thermoanaerobaculia bacterium]